MGIVKGILIAIYLVIALVLIVLTLIQTKEDPGLSSTITGSSTNNFYEKNKSRTKEGKQKKVDSYFISCICSINNSIRNCIYGIKRNKRGGFHKETTLFCTEIKTF